MAEPDTLRLLLQNKFDRIENLVQMNHAATLAIPSVLATIWGIEGGLNGFQNARIISIISIGLLLIWRYFAHYVDNDIAKTYVDVVKIEDRLGMPSNLSLYENNVDSLTNYKNCGKGTQKHLLLNQKLKELCSNHKIKFFECLYEKKKMGYRGHKEWDVVAILIISLLFGLLLFSRNFHVTVISRIMNSLAFLFLILITILVFTSQNIQKDPEIPKDFIEILIEFENPVK
jgi:hypothetical protein